MDEARVVWLSDGAVVRLSLDNGNPDAVDGEGHRPPDLRNTPGTVFRDANCQDLMLAARRACLQIGMVLAK